MAGKTDADRIYTQRAAVLYLQPGGPGVSAESDPKKLYKVMLAGSETSEASFTGVTVPVRGDVSRIFSYDPYHRYQFKQVATSEGPPERPSGTLGFHNKIAGAVLRHMRKLRCPWNVYVYFGSCHDVSDRESGWDLIGIGSRWIGGEQNFGDLVNHDSDDKTMTEVPGTMDDFYWIGNIYFDDGKTVNDVGGNGVKAIAFANKVNCGECGGTGDDGSEWIYAIAGGNTASSGGGPIPAYITYSTDAGENWSTAQAVGGTPDADQAMAAMVIGNYLVILGKGFTNAGFWYSELSGLGVPGSFTNQSTGFGTTTMNDFAMLSPAEIFIVGNSGYILKSSDFKKGASTVSAGTITTSNLNAIDGIDDTLVAVGAAGTVLYSHNRGVSWAAASASPVGTALSTVAVKSKYEWWVGTTSAGVYYTKNGGLSWTQVTVSGISGTVQKIIFPTAEKGYLVTGAGDVAGTVNGGDTWSDGAAHLNQIPTTGGLITVAAPDGRIVDRDVAANIVCIGGISADLTDGVVFTGKTGIF